MCGLPRPLAEEQRTIIAVALEETTLSPIPLPPAGSTAAPDERCGELARAWMARWRECLSVGSMPWQGDETADARPEPSGDCPATKLADFHAALLERLQGLADEERETERRKVHEQQQLTREATEDAIGVDLD